VEGFHRQVRKVTKTKGAFPNDMALLKLIYLLLIISPRNGHSLFKTGG